MMVQEGMHQVHAWNLKEHEVLRSCSFAHTVVMVNILPKILYKLHLYSGS
ncbi:hypothetical protein Hanom_Chr06g00556851 [Helianthus anomalus]